MAIALPNSPTLNQEVVSGDDTYKWVGDKWVKVTPIDIDRLQETATVKFFTDAKARLAISVAGDLSYNNVTGVISYTASSNIPTDLSDLTDNTNIIPDDLSDLGIADGTTGQVLTTNGAGAFTFQDTAGITDYDIEVVSSLPGSPVASTIYFIT
jgi:hypothetical protein